MKSILAAALAVGFLALCGCTTPAVAPSPATQLLVAKADYGFELAVNVAQNAYLTANAAGEVTAADKAKLKPLLDDALKAANLAHGAALTGDAPTFTAQAAAAMSLAQQVWAILKPGTPFPVTTAPTAPVS